MNAIAVLATMEERALMDLTALRVCVIQMWQEGLDVKVLLICASKILPMSTCTHILARFRSDLHIVSLFFLLFKLFASYSDE